MIHPNDFSIGPVVGGAINDSQGGTNRTILSLRGTNCLTTGWRWCFYLNIIYGAVLLPVYLFVLPSIPSRFGLPVLTRLRRIDFLGFVLEAAALCCFITPTAFGGSYLPWQSGTTIGLYVASGVLFILFCAQQKWAILTTEDDRLFPVKFMRSWEMCNFFVVMACVASCFFLTICIYHLIRRRCSVSKTNLCLRFYSNLFSIR